MKLKLKIQILIFCTILFLSYSYLETYWLKTTQIEIPHPDIPTSFKGNKIIFLSDIHHGKPFSRNRVKKLVDRINEMNPDIILLGGDYVLGHPKYVEPVMKELGHLIARLGVFSVLGNSDLWQDPIRTKMFMNDYGFHVCENNSFWVRSSDDSIKIGGVGDFMASTQKLDNTVFDLNPDHFCILLFHHPDYLAVLHDERIDLTFSGHTHGGQITFFGLFAFYVPSKYGQKYSYGLIKEGERISFISSGVGTVFLPLRFFCRPEIVEVTLK